MADSTDRLYEQILILRCQAGDEGAFAELVRRYQGRLRYYLRRLLDDRDKADDILQDTWCDVFCKLPRLRSPRAFPAWLYRIARDRAFRQQRRGRHVPRGIEEVDWLSQPQDEADFSAEEAGRIHVCLGRLSPPHREVLVLRFLENMTYDEIACTVGCRLGTVRSRIHFAKRALRREMERSDDDRKETG